MAHGEGVTVVITRSSVAGAPAGEMTDVMLNIEVTETETAQLYGYRSMNSMVDIDCVGGRDRVRKALAFELPHFAGPSHLRRTSGEWVRPTPGAFMSDVIEKACASAGLLPSSPTLAAALPAASSQAPVASPKPTVAPIVTQGPQAPYDAKQGGGAGRLRAQIASSRTEQGALQILEKAKSKISSTLTSEVETAVVRDKKVYRSVVKGFGSEAEVGFCGRMRQANVGCIVRRDSRAGGR